MSKIIKTIIVIVAFVISYVLYKKHKENEQNEKQKQNELNGALDGFFTTESIKNLDELKKQYRKLSMIYHPDKGGSDAQMQALNDEYDRLRAKLKAGANLSEEESRLEDELDEVYKDVIATLVVIPNVEIELIGSWIWVSGATYPIKDMLKELNFKYARNKKMWYWHADEKYKKRSKKKFSIEDIREMYKHEKIPNKYANRVLNGLYNDITYLQGLLNYR